MKKLFVLTVILVLLSRILHAQTKAGSIELRKHWYGFRLYQDDKEIKTIRKLTRIMQPDPIASDIFKKAKHFRTAGLAIYWTGLASVVGYDIYFLNKYPYGNYPPNVNPNFAFIGFGIAVLSLPFGFYFKRNMKKAIGIYNDDLHKTGCRGLKPKCYLSFSGRAVGLTIIPY